MVALRPSFLRLLRRSPGYLWTVVLGMIVAVVFAALGLFVWAVDSADYRPPIQGKDIQAKLTDKFIQPVRRFDGTMVPTCFVTLEFVDESGIRRIVRQEVAPPVYEHLPPAPIFNAPPPSVQVRITPGNFDDVYFVNQRPPSRLHWMLFGMAGVGVLIGAASLISLHAKYRLVHSGWAILGRITSQTDRQTLIRFEDQRGRVRQLSVMGRVNMPVVFLGRSGRAIAAAAVFDDTYLYQLLHARRIAPR